MTNFGSSRHLPGAEKSKGQLNILNVAGGRVCTSENLRLIQAVVL